ncbi:MAG: hypothetical protein HAW62_03620 [Endozoicomonadaceae bacterium]|nr:hypothetical protein [Endozoicomonadaceae bacterium]
MQIKENCTVETAQNVLHSLKDLKKHNKGERTTTVVLDHINSELQSKGLQNITQTDQTNMMKYLSNRCIAFESQEVVDTTQQSIDLLIDLLESSVAELYCNNVSQYIHFPFSEELDQLANHPVDPPFTQDTLRFLLNIESLFFPMDQKITQCLKNKPVHVEILNNELKSFMRLKSHILYHPELIEILNKTIKVHQSEDMQEKANVILLLAYIAKTHDNVEVQNFVTSLCISLKCRTDQTIQQKQHRLIKKQLTTISKKRKSIKKKLVSYMKTSSVSDKRQLFKIMTIKPIYKVMTVFLSFFSSLGSTLAKSQLQHVNQQFKKYELLADQWQYIGEEVEALSDRMLPEEAYITIQKMVQHTLSEVVNAILNDPKMNSNQRKETLSELKKRLALTSHSELDDDHFMRSIASPEYSLLLKACSITSPTQVRNTAILDITTAKMPHQKVQKDNMKVVQRKTQSITPNVHVRSPIKQPKSPDNSVTRPSLKLSKSSKPLLTVGYENPGVDCYIHAALKCMMHALDDVAIHKIGENIAADRLENEEQNALINTARQAFISLYVATYTQPVDTLKVNAALQAFKDACAHLAQQNPDCYTEFNAMNKNIQSDAAGFTDSVMALLNWTSLDSNAPVLSEVTQTVLLKHNQISYKLSQNQTMENNSLTLYKQDRKGTVDSVNLQTSLDSQMQETPVSGYILTKSNLQDTVSNQEADIIFNELQQEYGVIPTSDRIEIRSKPSGTCVLRSNQLSWPETTQKIAFNLNVSSFSTNLNTMMKMMKNTRTARKSWMESGDLSLQIPIKSEDGTIKKERFIPQSVIVHTGSQEGGHYFSYVIDKNEVYCHDDDHVYKVSKKRTESCLDTLKRAVLKNPVASPSMIYYQKA